MSLTAKKILVNIVILILVLASGLLMIVLKETQKETIKTSTSYSPSIVNTE